MLHYIQYLLSECVCLLFSAWQVVYSGFLNLFHCEQLPTNAENDSEGAWDWTKEQQHYSPDTYTELKYTLKLQIFLWRFNAMREPFHIVLTSSFDKLL